MSENAIDPKHITVDSTKPLRTPHEFINHHLQNPGEPITDEDIRNLKLDSGAVSVEHQVKDIVIISPEAANPNDEDDVKEEKTKNNGHQKI